jgi:hyperosmotically inducible protein
VFTVANGRSIEEKCMSNLLSPRWSGAAATSLLLAALALSGCSKTDEATVENTPADARVEEQPGGGVGTQMSQQAEETRADVAQGVEAAADGAREMAGDAKQAGAEAVDAATDKVADATITTSVNAALAKDDSLSALQINVDTDGGQVILRGTAPSAEARERATTLAMAVQGVKRVDNQLTVDATKK